MTPESVPARAPRRRRSVWRYLFLVLAGLVVIPAAGTWAWYTWPGSVSAVGLPTAPSPTPKGGSVSWVVREPQGFTARWLATGSDHAAWLYESYQLGHLQVERVEPSGRVRIVAVPGFRPAPGPGVVDDQGNLWFVSSPAPPRVVRVSADGAITQYPVADAVDPAHPRFAAGAHQVFGEPFIGADGLAWFVGAGHMFDRVAASGAGNHVDPALAGVVRNGPGAPSADGSTWFVGYRLRDPAHPPAKPTNRDLVAYLARMPSSGPLQVINLEAIPVTDTRPVLGAPVLATDGAVWFSESSAAESSLDRATADGHVMRYPMGDSLDFNASLVFTPDGRLWPQSGSSGLSGPLRATLDGTIGPCPVAGWRSAAAASPEAGPGSFPTYYLQRGPGSAFWVYRPDKGLGLLTGAC